MIATGYRKRVTVLLFILLLVRFWLGRTFELTGPEALAWLEGRHLDWGYWDRGPVVPLLSAIGTFFFGQNELGVRWLASVIYAGSGFFLFYTTRQWFSARAGFYAVLLFALLPLYAWQMLLLSETTASVGLMALALLAYHHAVYRNHWADWLLAAVLSAVALTVSWWNLLWPAGLLLFRLIDSQRRERWFIPRVGLFIAVTLLGFLPFIVWHLHQGLLANLGSNAAEWLAPKHQLADPSLPGPLAFLRSQFVWLGFLGFLGLLVILLRARDYVFLRRSHLFLLCLAIPGLLLQFALSFFGWHNQDIVPALYLPLLSLAGSVGTRLTDADHRWRNAALAVFLLAGIETVTGLIPWTAARCWSHYAPNRQERNRSLAIEVARVQREQGGSFLIVDDPQKASLLSFYLPLQPFVYVLPTVGVHTQFDLWPSYFDFEVTNALLMTRAAQPTPEIVREFEAVHPLPGAIPTPEAAPWHFFLCERFGATKPASEP